LQAVDLSIHNAAERVIAAYDNELMRSDYQDTFALSVSELNNRRCPQWGQVSIAANLCVGDFVGEIFYK